jgi:hypothetical protein
MKPKLTGEEALALFNIASNFVKVGELDKARAMKDQLLKSDWVVIERRIIEAEGRST